MTASTLVNDKETKYVYREPLTEVAVAILRRATRAFPRPAVSPQYSEEQLEELRRASEEECIQALQANETHRAKWNLELWDLLDAALKEADPLRVEEIHETLRAEGYFELPKLSVIPLTVVEEEAPSVIELRDELADNETQMVALEDEHDRLLTSHGMERCDRCGLPRPPDTPFPGRNCPSCGAPPVSCGAGAAVHEPLLRRLPRSVRR